MFYIGNVLIPEKTVLAPLAGITSLPMRLMAKEEGCGLVCTEMISSNGLFYNSERTWEMLESSPAEKPVSVQIFGSVPDIMAYAAARVEENGADIIDINFGCSVKKVMKTGSGVELMRDPEKSGAVIKAVRKAIKIPLTIKIRTGWDRSGDQAEKLARIAEDSGVDAITVHPRTATQAFGGTADWDLITRIKQLVSVPVIGNGDITSPAKALQMIKKTGCDAVMTGRAAMSGPQIFSQINAALNGYPVPEFDVVRHFASMKSYIDAIRKGEMDIDKINNLMSSLEALKADKNYSKISIQLTSEELDVLVGRIYEYTMKLASDNEIEIAADDLEEEKDVIKNLQSYLKVQRRIFAEAA